MVGLRALVVSALMLVACARGDGPVHDSSTASASASASAGSTAAATPGSTPAAAPSAARPLVALDGDGVMLVAQPSGSTRTIAFGTSAETALSAISASLGVERSRGTNQECGAGPLEFVTFDGLLVAVQQGKFVGWTTPPSDSTPLTTMSGVGIGSTRAALDAAYAARVARSTLGVEFSAGGLQGILASNADSARITDLWAGTNCVAR
ncbi:MAG: hypothetical protein V4617_19155 [Gemmatimonadota bacterium]